MFPGDHLPVDGTEEQSNPTKGSACLKSAQDILSARDPVSRGNTIPTDLISTQPVPVAEPPAEASQEAAGFKKHQSDLQKPICPQCGLTVPDQRLPPLPAGLSQLQGPSLSVHSSSRRSRSRSRTRSRIPAYSCCWRACRARARRCSWVCWRPVPPASTPSAPPAATPAPAAVRPSRRHPWRSSTATPTATRCFSSPAVSQPSVSSFVWSAARSAIAARRQLDHQAGGLTHKTGGKTETTDI